MAELLCAEGARAEHHSFENVVTHRAKKFVCHVTVRMFVRT